MSIDFREEYLANAVEEQRKRANSLWWQRLLFALAGACFLVAAIMWLLIDVHEGTSGTSEWILRAIIALADFYIAMLLHEKYTAAMAELKKRAAVLMTYRERRPYIR